MTMLRSRAAHRSCRLHGDNGCEIQGEAGLRERRDETRLWRHEAEHEAQDALFPPPQRHARRLRAQPRHVDEHPRSRPVQTVCALGGVL